LHLNASIYLDIFDRRDDDPHDSNTTMCAGITSRGHKGIALYFRRTSNSVGIYSSHPVQKEKLPLKRKVNYIAPQ